MDIILRGAAIYLVLWLIFRIAGKRSLAEITTFDFVLLLIISETTQNPALQDGDNSVTNSILLILTLVGMDIGLSIWKQRSEHVEKFFDSVPLVVLENGKVIPDRMNKSRIDAEDILAAARKLCGLERLEQIKYAVLERNGGITVIPKEENK